MRKAMSASSLAPKASLVRRTNSSKNATAYYSTSDISLEVVVQAEPINEIPVVTATVLPVDESAFPLKVGQAVNVTKAGTWISELARIKKVHPDGTYDVSVFSIHSSNVGDLKEDYVLTHKPYPGEVKEASSSAAARIRELESKPPGLFDKYTVDVVREHGGRDEWGRITINEAGFRWDETVRTRNPSFWDMVLGSNRSRFNTETIPGAEEKNQKKLVAKIKQATGWKDVADVYCLGSKLEEFHMFRVHSIMKEGRPLVVLGEGQTYDKQRWAAPHLAERPKSDECCVIS